MIKEIGKEGPKFAGKINDLNHAEEEKDERGYLEKIH